MKCPLCGAPGLKVEENNYRCPTRGCPVLSFSTETIRGDND